MEVEKVRNDVCNKLSDRALQDYQWIMAARESNDRTAYTRLMNRYHDTLYFMLLKLTRNTFDAEDLAIQTFGKAFRNLHSYTPQYSFSTWLFKIGTNNYIDFVRGQKLAAMPIVAEKKPNEIGISSDEILDEERSPEELLIREQKILMVRAITQQLKPHYRRLIELRYFQEKSYDEISEEMDLPIGTIKNQLFRSKELLYNILKNKESILND
ncbi:MAG: sigma-70 family RNA polymerase sigma factor [Bacteroidales bacterium]|nr:sigma-70 family RNA polymerase sigma factor [Bacteroidales bacterium]